MRLRERARTRKESGMFLVNRPFVAHTSKKIGTRMGLSAKWTSDILKGRMASCRSGASLISLSSQALCDLSI
jgi:hypothetical protein